MKSSSATLPAQRQQQILDMLRKEFSIRSAELSERFGVSEMTIRRDLEVLVEQGLVERIHGGAVYRQERVAGKFQFRHSLQENLAVKQRIAQKAATLIDPHDTIFLGEGATAAAIIAHMDPAMPMTIFTNNLGATAHYQNQAAELILLGGRYSPATHSVSGSLTMEMIRRVHATKVFLGVDAIHLNAGLTTPDLEIAVTERCMIGQSYGKVIAMADQPKFGLVAEMEIAPLKRIDVLVTDCKLTRSMFEELEKLRVEVMVV